MATGGFYEPSPGAAEMIRHSYDPRMFRSLGLLLSLTLALTAAAQKRPAFTIDTKSPYDASQIAAYQGAHANVYAHIDRNIDAHVANLQRRIRQRSISRPCRLSEP